MSALTLEARLLKSAGEGLPNLQLRQDKVVLRVAVRLQEALGDVVPRDVTVLVTMTAPIKLPGRTVGAVQERIEAALPGRDDVSEVIHGNSVRICFAKGRLADKRKVVLLVHNRDVDGEALMGLAQSLVETP